MGLRRTSQAVYEASILWYGHRSTGNGFCEVTFDRMWASCFIG